MFGWLRKLKEPKKPKEMPKEMPNTEGLAMLLTLRVMENGEAQIEFAYRPGLEDVVATNIFNLNTGIYFEDTLQTASDFCDNHGLEASRHVLLTNLEMLYRRYHLFLQQEQGESEEPIVSPSKVFDNVKPE